MITCAMLMLAASSCPSKASPQAEVRIPVSDCTGSAAVAGYAMTYDAGRRQVVIFGGETAGGTLSGETWGWNGREWRCLAGAAPTGPGPRSAAMLAYDPSRQVLVLYGGRVGREPLSDTWELSAAGWSRKNSAGPTPDPHGVLAYDSIAAGILLYHSLGDDGPARATWRWDGTAWTRVGDGPNQEFPNAMFAGVSGQPAMLITARPTGTPDAFEPPVYRWNGKQWGPVEVSGVSPHFSPQAPAARTATGAILFAGFEPDRSVTTWILRAGAWQRYAGQSPPRRRGAQMIFDPARSVAVLHAGEDDNGVRSDTWEWDGTGWRRIP